MATFKPGDRVIYTGFAAHGNWDRYRANLTPATVKRLFGSDIDVNFDGDGKTYTLLPGKDGKYDLELIGSESKSPVDVRSLRTLVGPAPKVEPPLFQAPFKFDEGEWVLDAQGNRVLRLPDGMDRKVAKGDTQADYDTWDDFASYVAEALNEKVNREAA